MSVVFGGKSTACTPLQGSDVTDKVLRGCDLHALGAVGKEVMLELVLAGNATLYTFGFQ